MTYLRIARTAAASVVPALMIAGLAGCTPDPRAQLASVVECLQANGWNAELDPNELAYGTETTARQDFDDYQADEAGCRQQAGLPLLPRHSDMSTFLPEDFAG